MLRSIQVRTALLLVMGYDLLFGHGKIDGGGQVRTIWHWGWGEVEGVSDGWIVCMCACVYVSLTVMDFPICFTGFTCYVR